VGPESLFIQVGLLGLNNKRQICCPEKMFVQFAQFKRIHICDVNMFFTEWLDDQMFGIMLHYHPLSPSSNMTVVVLFL